MVAAIALAALLAVTLPAPSGTASFPHVRALNSRIAHMVAEGIRLSPTFARLHRELQNTDVILFLRSAADLRPGISGRLVLLSATKEGRYLRADLRRDLARVELIAAIAHEMQHALEIARHNTVRDEHAVRTLFWLIGMEARQHSFETDAAQEVAMRVRTELLA
jgi:hypothetical protein